MNQERKMQTQQQKKKNKKLFNILMIAMIAVIAFCSVMAVGHISEFCISDSCAEFSCWIGLVCRLGRRK